MVCRRSGRGRPSRPFPNFLQHFDRAQPHPTRKHIAAVPVPAARLTVARKADGPCRFPEAAKKDRLANPMIVSQSEAIVDERGMGSFNPCKEALNAHRANRAIDRGDSAEAL